MQRLFLLQFTDCLVADLVALPIPPQVHRGRVTLLALRVGQTAPGQHTGNGHNQQRKSGHDEEAVADSHGIGDGPNDWGRAERAESKEPRDDCEPSAGFQARDTVRLFHGGGDDGGLAKSNCCEADECAGNRGEGERQSHAGGG